MFTKNAKGLDIITSNGDKVNTSTQTVASSNYQVRHKFSSSNASKFKLATIRKLKTYTSQQLQEALATSYKILESIAVRDNKPTPFPVPPSQVLEDRQVYGVFIDEDLDKNAAPVYTFVGTGSLAKVFITNTGHEKEDWSVHIAHQLKREVNLDNTVSIRWRLITIDSTNESKQYYFLENTELPSCFSFNFDLSNISYLGGGTWNAIGIDIEDTIPVVSSAPTNNSRYKSVGAAYRFLGNSETQSVVAYSITPTYSFTWNRNVLKINKRTREAKQELDIASIQSANVLKFTRSHDYSLPITERLGKNANSFKLLETTHVEYSKGTATYVGNTNAPEIASPNQTPDYGTDKKRLSISDIYMDTNVIRPVLLSTANVLPANKMSITSPGASTIVVASPKMEIYLKHDYGAATGRITHPYELKKAYGKRGFQYGEYYKLWWVYGQVVQTYAYGDTNRYVLLREPIYDSNGVPQGNRAKIGSMLDLGELRISPTYKNAVETTWESMANPPSGYFNLQEGTLSFVIEYNSPPLIGHNGVYYYYKNPPVVGIGSGAFEVDSSIAEQRNTTNQLRMLYSQMLGGLGGGGVNSLDIGNVFIASNDIESIVVRQPNTTQKAALNSQPETFPKGYFETEYYGFTLDNNNKGVMSIYDTQGNLVATNIFN